MQPNDIKFNGERSESAARGVGQRLSDDWNVEKRELEDDCDAAPAAGLNRDTGSERREAGETTFDLPPAGRNHGLITTVPAYDAVEFDPLRRKRRDLDGSAGQGSVRVRDINDENRSARHKRLATSGKLHADGWPPDEASVAVLGKEGWNERGREQS